MNINQIVYQIVNKITKWYRRFLSKFISFAARQSCTRRIRCIVLMNVNQMVYKIVNQHGILDFYPISYFLLEAAQGVLSGVRDNPVQQRITELHCCSFSPLWLC